MKIGKRRYTSEKEQINVKGLVNVLKIPMQTSTKVASSACVPPFPIQVIDGNLPLRGFVL